MDVAVEQARQHGLSGQIYGLAVCRRRDGTAYFLDDAIGNQDAAIFQHRAGGYIRHGGMFK